VVSREFGGRRFLEPLEGATSLFLAQCQVRTRIHQLIRVVIEAGGIRPTQQGLVVVRTRHGTKALGEIRAPLRVQRAARPEMLRYPLAVRLESCRDGQTVIAASGEIGLIRWPQSGGRWRVLELKATHELFLLRRKRSHLAADLAALGLVVAKT
jgi:hypothetical protein